jgi:hypothetical protein
VPHPAKPAAPSISNPSAPKSAPSGSPGAEGETTVQQALNALAACAETLVQKHPEGPDKQVCLVQLNEAKRLISELRGPAPKSTPPPPPRATDGPNPAPARG